ncbi:MAG: sulfatase [Tannerellaceae bacterium]|jgi:arylsulfatase|nr:sulfatase [Tannerellaceae bacterium]
MKNIKAISLGLLPLLSGMAMGQNVQKQPNLVVIFCDDLGYGDIGCFGNPTIKTPNIDRMASEGMKLTQFYVGAAVSTPSRSALLTGRLPVRNGMYGERNHVLFPDSKAGLGQDEITMAKVLKENGYATACVGKWHLGAFSPYLPTDHGFDSYFGIPYSNDMGTGRMGRAQNYPPTPLLENNLRIESNPDQGEITRRYTEKAVGFIKDQKAGKPFFLYFAHTFPHVPLYTNDRFRGTSKRGLYGDVVEEIDWSVGLVLKTLEECGLDENTLVIFTSDNGPWLTQKENGGTAGSLRDGKGTWWEGGFRVPAIARMPGKIPASLSSEIMTSMDIMPTFLALAGIALPKGVALDGVDQRGLLFERQASARDEVFYWWGSDLMAVRKGAWKLYFKTIYDMYLPSMKIVDCEVPELYNLETDISERFNKSAAQPQIVAQLVEVANRHKQAMVIKAPVCDLREEFKQ